MINKFIGIGHLTKDPETKSFESSNTKCSFSLAINNSKDEVLFYGHGMLEQNRRQL